MYFNTIPKILALVCLGSLPAQANPPYNPNKTPPPPTVPKGPTPSGYATNPACCGYELVNRGGAYFRYTHEIDFDKLKSLDSVTTAGWQISHGWQVGPSNPSTGRKAIADENNIELIPGQGLRLKVPKQTKDARSFSVAEIIFPDIVLGGVIEAEIKLTGVSGTVTDFMTTHADNTLDSGNLGWRDAQAIELLSNSLLKSAGNQPVGINMVNFDSKSGAQSSTSHPFPSGLNPTTGFNKYEIAWYPPASTANAAIGTETFMRLNGEHLNAPPKYMAVNPQVITLSHWCNADTNWGGLPPTQDAYVIIKRVVAYYDRPIKMATGTSVSRDTCKREKACKVSI